MSKASSVLNDSTLRKDQETAEFFDSVKQYVSSGDSSVIQLSTGRQWRILSLGEAVATTASWGIEENRIAEYCLHLMRTHAGTAQEGAAISFFSGFIRGFLQVKVEKGASTSIRDFFDEAIRSGISNLSLATHIFGHLSWEWDIVDEHAGEPIFQSESHQFVWSLFDITLIPLFERLGENGVLIQLAKYRPHLVKVWLDSRFLEMKTIPVRLWPDLLKGGSESFLPEALKSIELAHNQEEKWTILEALNDIFPDRFQGMTISLIGESALAAEPAAMLWLSSREPRLAMRLLAHLIGTESYNYIWAGFDRHWGYDPVYEVAAKKLGGEGAAVFEAASRQSDPRIHYSCILALTEHAPKDQNKLVEKIVRSFIQNHSIEHLEKIWAEVLKISPAILISELWELLGSKSKKLRLIAVEGLMQAMGLKAFGDAVKRLSDKKVPARLGAVALLAAINRVESYQSIKVALESETSEVVRASMQEVLLTNNGSLKSMDFVMPTAPMTDLSELEKSLGTRKAKSSGISCATPETLPEVFSTGGAKFSKAAVAFVLEKQSKYKNIKPAPDLASWLRLIDRSKSGDFALALLNSWLAEGSDSKHRWVLALAGTLGDSRIISILLTQIPKWCDSSRHKLAEYAAQAISLLGSNEALMVLDTLATRYRSKFKNVGAAAAKAFQSAAESRGMSPDELGDLVVPTFEFNEDGQRTFVWDGGSALAELTMELKLEWSDPETEKSWKTLPTGASEEVKAEVKELTKLLREAGKAQVLRLEQALVKQRRWPVAAWRKLYELHPLLRAYATRLVWGVYDATGGLLRTFRRYPNGLLADANGGLEELPETELLIGLVHPLDLEDSLLAAWRAHLARFKVAAPFAQLDRPVERLEASHHNRRELAVAEGGSLSCGTFRSRAEKRS